MHTITTRSQTADEQQLIAARVRPDFASYGCIVILFAVIATLGLGKIGGWLFGIVSADAATYGQWAGWSAGAILFVSALVAFIPYERRQRHLASIDHETQLVQDIQVTASRVIQIGLIDDNEPILAFDVGEHKILYLQGQWLWDHATYGAEPLEGDAYEEYINGLPAPHSFPSTKFTVTRFPNSGEVVSIRVSGGYCVPETEVEALQPEYEFGQSELLDGSVDDIAGVLAREHEHRQVK